MSQTKDFAEICLEKIDYQKIQQQTDQKDLILTCNTCIILLNGDKFVHHHGDQNKQLNHRLVSYLYPKMIYFSVRLPIRQQTVKKLNYLPSTRTTSTNRRLREEILAFTQLQWLISKSDYWGGRSFNNSFFEKSNVSIPLIYETLNFRLQSESTLFENTRKISLSRKKVLQTKNKSERRRHKSIIHKTLVIILLNY